MKGPRELIAVAVTVMILLYGLHSLVTPDLGQRNVEALTEMVYSKANESFGLSDILPGGHNQQPLVAGVVARDAMFFPYGVGVDEAARAGRELKNPYTNQDADAMEEGRRLFGIYCALCHDAGGNGRGKVIEHGMLPPPSLHALRAMGLKDGEMFHILTRGQGNMASYASQMSPDERWKVILHVRKLQESN